MAPNPRFAKAFCAMRDLGIPEEKTKPVLLRLLKLYEKKWKVIEEENYRALIDAIFDQDEQQVAEKNKPVNNDEVEASETDETEIPLKRSRLKYQDNSSLSIVETPLKHKQPQNLGGGTHQHYTRNRGKRALLLQEQSEACKKAGYRDKGKSPLQKLSHALCLKEPLTKKKLNATRALIKTKDKQITDGMPQIVLPISVIHPDPLNKEASSDEENTVRWTACPESINDEDGHTFPNKKRTSEKAQNVVGDPSTDIEIAASSSGEMKISLTCNSAIGRSDFLMPSMDVVLKMMEDQCLRSYNIVDPSFSLINVMRNMCDCILKLGTDSGNELVDAVEVDGLLKHSDTVGGNEMSIGPIPLNISLPCTDSNRGQHVDSANEENGSENSNPRHKKDSLSSPHDHDIAKGHENLVITLVNEVNDECPPSFFYISQNVVLKNAYVSFSLVQLGGNTSCAACSGNCLSSLSSCACALGSHCAYTIDGLVKEDFLNECISMNHGPKKNCQYYCKECPLERLKNEDILEPCKGHLARKFIKECWWKCGCSKQCGNRVVQRSITINLQVFMTSGGKGWGLRTLQDLPKGAFVCEYVGEILTYVEFYKRVSARRNGETYAYPVLLDADWCAEGVLKDEEALCLDATHYGNIARFINHRCFDPNLVEIPVEVETPNHHYYHLAFFTTREVKALEELTWDYGIDFDEHEGPVKAFKCQCGSKFCRHIKHRSRSRSRR